VLISVASEDMERTNSVHDSRSKSLKSLLNRKPSGMLSEIILLMVALGNDCSSFSIIISSARVFYERNILFILPM
jgi:hypothetical protein